MKNDKANALEEAKREIGGIIQNLNSVTACFTGHRSHKLPWGYNEDDDRCIAMKATLRSEIEKAISRGYTTFLCGMAIGFDMICAETVLDLKNRYDGIKIVGALPCKTQDAKWADREKERYGKLLSKLDGVRCIYDRYVGAQCMIERNRYMVNSSSLLIALFDGQPGGTKSTVEYAERQGLEIVIIEP